MTRLLLTADLHFGCEDPRVVSDMIQAIESARPDMVVIAGDFVQRARPSHYAPARAFVDQISVPVFAVPGNHDIPLYNIGARWLRPRAAYRRWIDSETEPVRQLPDVSLIGLDTTDPFSRQAGRVRAAQIARVSDWIRAAGDRLPIIVAHHPFHQRTAVAKKIIRNAPRALSDWADAGPHMILSGHVHTFLAEPFVARKEQGMTLQVHCGSSTSTRRRGAPNDFAILDIEDRTVAISQMIHQPGASFDEAASYRFTRSEIGWQVG